MISNIHTGRLSQSELLLLHDDNIIIYIYVIFSLIAVVPHSVVLHFFALFTAAFVDVNPDEININCITLHNIA